LRNNEKVWAVEDVPEKASDPNEKYNRKEGEWEEEEEEWRGNDGIGR
jgi:hypothetical protein